MSNVWKAEMTDLFGGEANYSWVKRAEFTMPDNASQRAIMRKAKKQFGLNGARGVTDSFGDSYSFKPYGSCIILFVA